MKDIQKIKEFFSKPLNEEETAIDTAKKQLDDLGAKYEMSGNKFKPFKAIYKPIGKSDDWYDTFDEIVYLFNLGSAVKSSMSEASPLTKLGRKIGWAGEDWTPQEFAAQIKKLPNETLLKWAEGNKGISNTPLAFQQKLVKIELAKRGLNEAEEEDVVDTITMDIPLFIRMLEYSREDASADVDLHDVTEKAISLNKEKDILSMDDYNEIVGAAEEIEEGLNEAKGSKGDIVIYKDKNNKKIESKIVKVDVDENDPFSTYELENGDFVNVKDVIKINKAVKEAVNLKASKLSSAEYQKAKKLKSFKANDWKWNADEDLYNKVNEGVGSDLDEPYFIEISLRDARIAMDMFDDKYRRSNIKMHGSNVYAANTPEDIYDLYYDFKNQDIEVLDYNVDGDLDEATDYMKRRKAQDDYAVSKKDKPAKSYNPKPSGKTDYMKRREKELAEAILTKLKK
jgi:hypothetical protein